MSIIDRHAVNTSLQQSTTPMSSKGEHTRAPNILPPPSGPMGQANPISGANASNPGKRQY